MHKKTSLQLTLASLALAFSPFLQSSEIIQVESRNAQVRTTLGSTVIPYKQVTLSAQMPGRVEYIAGDAGAAFTKGVLLVKINEDNLKAKHTAAQAQLANAQAALHNARTQYNHEIVAPRSKDISMAPGFGMPAMMDIMMTRPMANMMGNEVSDPEARLYSDRVKSATQVSQAEGSVLQAQSGITEIESKQRDTQSLSPFDGMILHKRVEVGDTVQPGQALIEFAYIKNLRLQADVPSSLVSSLSAGMVVPVKIDSRLETQARVSQIYPTADPARHTVIVKFDLPLKTLAAPGMYAEIYIPDQVRNNATNVVIPRSALISGRSLPAVLVVNNDNQSKLRMVRLGSEQGHGLVEVVSGLKSGERIIDQPPAGVSSGWMPTPKTVPATHTTEAASKTAVTP